VNPAEYRACPALSQGFKLDDSHPQIWGSVSGGKSAIIKNLFTHHCKQHRYHLGIEFFFDAHRIMLQRTAKVTCQLKLLEALQDKEMALYVVNLLANGSEVAFNPGGFPLSRSS